MSVSWPLVIVVLFAAALPMYALGVPFVVAMGPCLAVCFGRLAIIISRDDR